MISYTYSICPKCESPEIEPLDECFKCKSCKAIFEFEEEVTVELECPKCGDRELIEQEIGLDGSYIYLCPSCPCSWTEY